MPDPTYSSNVFHLTVKLINTAKELEAALVHCYPVGSVWRVRLNCRQREFTEMAVVSHDGRGPTVRFKRERAAVRSLRKRTGWDGAGARPYYKDISPDDIIERVPCGDGNPPA